MIKGGGTSGYHDGDSRWKQTASHNFIKNEKWQVQWWTNFISEFPHAHRSYHAEKSTESTPETDDEKDEKVYEEVFALPCSETTTLQLPVPSASTDHTTMRHVQNPPLHSLREDLLDRVETIDGVRLIVPSFLNEDTDKYKYSRYDEILTLRPQPKFAVCVYMDRGHDEYNGPADCGTDWPVIPLPLVHDSFYASESEMLFSDELSHIPELEEFDVRLEESQGSLRNHYGDVSATLPSWNNSTKRFEATVVVQNIRYRPCQSLVVNLDADLVPHQLVEGSVVRGAGPQQESGMNSLENGETPSFKDIGFAIAGRENPVRIGCSISHGGTLTGIVKEAGGQKYVLSCFHVLATTASDTTCKIRQPDVDSNQRFLQKLKREFRISLGLKELYLRTSSVKPHQTGGEWWDGLSDGEKTRRIEQWKTDTNQGIRQFAFHLEKWYHLSKVDIRVIADGSLTGQCKDGLDCAMVPLNDDVDYDNRVVEAQSFFSGEVAVSLPVGTDVMKRGSRTGFTTGGILGNKHVLGFYHACRFDHDMKTVRVRVKYNSTQNIPETTFTKQILIGSRSHIFALPGDSGSLVLLRTPLSGLHAVAVVHCVVICNFSDKHRKYTAVAAPVQPILDHLNVSFATSEDF